MDKVYEFGHGRIREHLGGIYDFLERKKMENLRELERRNTPMSPSLSAAITPKEMHAAPERSAKKLSYEEQKEQARRLRKLEKAVADSEREIANMERKISELEARMATPEGAADASLFAEHDNLQKALSDAMDRWAKATEALDAEKKES